MEIVVSRKSMLIVHLLIATVLIPVCISIFWILHGDPAFLQTINVAFVSKFIIAWIFGLVIHELLHGIGFWLAGAPRAQIRFVLVSGVTPATHCKVAVSKNGYIIAALMPFVFLGLVPLLVAYLLGNVLILCWSIIMILAATGDLHLVSKCVLVNGNAKILDLKEEIGFTIQI